VRIPAQTRPRQLISFTPLIDVVFILLLFFMLASSFLKWHSIDLNIPAETAAGTSQEGALLVRLHADGRLDLNGRPLSLVALGERVGEHLQRKPRQRILVQPERGVSVQRIVAVLDRLHGVGGRNVSLTRG
jgi:biopolymer transport protein ExbD